MPPPRIINKMIIPNEIKVMTQQIIPQIIPAMVRPFPSGFIWPASILARSLLPIIQAGMPVKNQQRTKLRMPNIRISMPRWGSIAPGADSFVGWVVSFISIWRFACEKTSLCLCPIYFQPDMNQSALAKVYSNCTVKSNNSSYLTKSGGGGGSRTPVPIKPISNVYMLIQGWSFGGRITAWHEFVHLVGSKVSVENRAVSSFNLTCCRRLHPVAGIREQTSRVMPRGPILRWQLCFWSDGFTRETSHPRHAIRNVFNRSITSTPPISLLF